MGEGTTERRQSGTTVVTPTLRQVSAGDLVDVAGELYIATGLTRPIVLTVDTPEALLRTVQALEGLPLQHSVLPAMALLTAGFGLLGLWLPDEVVPAMTAIPALLSILIAPLQLSRSAGWLAGRYAALVPWAAWVTSGVTGAATWVLTGHPAAALLAAAWAGAGFAAVQAATTLLAGFCDRFRLCWCRPGLRRSLGWRGLFFGIRPVAEAVAWVLGWGLARTHDPLRGPLARHGQPRVRRHLSCAARMEQRGRAGWPLQAPATVGLGAGLPDALSLWSLARQEAVLTQRWLDLPYDGSGVAAWEDKKTPREVPGGEAALHAAQTIEVLADVAWLLRGVAVVLPAPGRR